MYYRFPLRQLYRADYKNKIWSFKRPDKRDLHAVSEWLAASVGRSEAWRRRMYKQLLQEFSTTAGRSRPMSWIVTASGNRVCWVDIEEAAPPVSHRLHGGEAQIHLTAPPNLLRNNRAALILWRRALKYVLTLKNWQRLRVQLDAYREAEVRALEKLGFQKEGVDHVLDLTPD